MSAFRSGFVTVVGRPNVGKSTLLNRLIGQKILIESDKPQATRNRIQCVYTESDFQIVFLDTPGIHKPHHKLGEVLVHNARASLRDVDVIFFMVEADQDIGPGDRYIAELLPQEGTPVFLLVNKIDKVSKEKVLPLMSKWSSIFEFEEYVPISAVNGDGLELLVELIKKHLPEGPRYYPEDMITDQPERFIIAEMVREKILDHTREEIPYSVAIDIRLIEERDSKLYIAADILVERDSQKGIVIGKNGTMLKQIGKEARSDIENLLATDIYLDLHVRSKSNWRNKEMLLSQLGYKRE